MKNVNLKTLLTVLLPLCGTVHSLENVSTAAPWPFIEYHNRISVFYPFHQTYERIKPDDFYVGVETWATPVIANNHHGSVALETELRFGYNLFYNGRDHLTPVVGGGMFKTTTRHGKYKVKWDGLGNLYFHEPHRKIPAVGYGTLGFLYDHEVNSIFNLGVNFKGMVGHGGSSSHYKWGSVVVGFDTAVPITFRFGHKRHWDARIEPFDIYLHGTHRSRNFFGLRSTVGYRF
jgi:hypothetical protein